MTVKRPNMKASKTDILKAFDALNDELKQSQKNGKSEPVLPAEHTAVVFAPSESSQNNAKKESTPVVAEEQHSIEEVTRSLHALKAHFGNAVSNLSTQQSAEATRLATFREEAEVLSRQLAELHGIKEVSDSSLPNVLREYAEKSESYKKELSEKTEAAEKDLFEKRKAWSKEMDERARSTRERNDTAAKATKRDQDEYDYELAQKRKHDVELDEQDNKKLQRQLDEFQQGREKAWAAKEKEVSEREKQVAEVLARFEELPAKQEAALKKARGEGAAIAGYQAKVKADLLAKEIEGERRVAELKIKSLESTIQEQLTRIDSLNKQLQSALKQGQDLTVKAIEGASNASTFVAVKEIALEQAKNLPKGK
jgi:DNA repair exonuclease SbcCD ATPase subunit